LNRSRSKLGFRFSKVPVAWHHYGATSRPFQDRFRAAHCAWKVLPSGAGKSR
jgi:hypothetical protein